MSTKLVKCKTCGADVAKSAKTCPSCGAKNKHGHPILAGILIFFGICMVIAAMGGSGNMTKDKVTLEKFNAISAGMSYKEVVDVIGFEGDLNSQVDLQMGDAYKTEIYTWANPTGSNMNATFQGGVVVSKAQVGLK